MDATQRQLFARSIAKVLGSAYPDGIKPEDYTGIFKDLEIGFKILDLSIQLVPETAALPQAPQQPAQSDTDKLGVLLRTSVEQKGTFVGVPAKVDGLSKGARTVRDCIVSGKDTVRAIMKVTSYNRSYIYIANIYSIIGY